MRKAFKCSIYALLPLLLLSCDFDLPEKKSLKDNCQFPSQIIVTPDSNNRSKVIASLNNLNTLDITSINWCYGVAQGTPCSTGSGGGVKGSESFVLPSEGSYTISAIVTSVCGEKRTLSTSYSYTLPKPQFYSFSPASGGWGDTLVLKGEQLDVKSVTINGAQAEVINSSDSEITIKVPERSGSGKIAITDNYGSVSSLNDFKYTERYYVKELMDFKSENFDGTLTNLIPRADGTLTAVMTGDVSNGSQDKDFLSIDVNARKVLNSQLLNNSILGGFVWDFFEKDQLLYFRTREYLKKINETGNVETVYDFSNDLPKDVYPMLNLAYDPLNDTFLTIIQESDYMWTLFKIKMEGLTVKYVERAFEKSFALSKSFNSSLVKGNELILSYHTYGPGPIQDSDGLSKINLLTGEQEGLTGKVGDNYRAYNRTLISLGESLIFQQLNSDNEIDLMSFNTITKELEVLNSEFSGNGSEGKLKEEKFSNIEALAAFPNTKDFYLVDGVGTSHILKLIEFK